MIVYLAAAIITIVIVFHILLSLPSDRRDGGGPISIEPRMHEIWLENDLSGRSLASAAAAAAATLSPLSLAIINSALCGRHGRRPSHRTNPPPLSSHPKRNPLTRCLDDATFVLALCGGAVAAARDGWVDRI